MCIRDRANRFRDTASGTQHEGEHREPVLELRRFLDEIQKRLLLDVYKRQELYEVYRMWCEENSLNAIKARGFSDALIANQRRYNLESTNNIVNSSGRRVRGFVGIEALVQPDLTPNGLSLIHI